MERIVDINLAEKERLRRAIDQQTQLFLRRGGQITEVPAPLRQTQYTRGVVWQDPNAASEVMNAIGAGTDA